jgi:hypothetical protein
MAEADTFEQAARVIGVRSRTEKHTEQHVLPRGVALEVEF